MGRVGEWGGVQQATLPFKYCIEEHNYTKRDKKKKGRHNNTHSQKNCNRKIAWLLSCKTSHLPDTWWGSSNMRDNCSSLTIALCLLLLFPFSLLPFPLLVSRQKIERKKIATDRNLSYYTAECPKHETEISSLCLLIYLFILYLPFFPPSSLPCGLLQPLQARLELSLSLRLLFSFFSVFLWSFFFFGIFFFYYYFPQLFEHLDGFFFFFFWRASDFSEATRGRVWWAW